ncbi:glycosyltransferase [Lactiplantibacillus daoliensis]|uniref:Glycosyltransferase n=1 Tax=Lactiplantibacillus daoliensis TaxID=2559916 RepID=A0ABW1UEY0_9LACO|nr:glycosyltransferase [Lactiplantibacillus daoliensis]
MRIVMIDDNDIVSDSRILKEAVSLQTRHEVLILGMASDKCQTKIIRYRGTKLRVNYIALMPNVTTKFERFLRYMIFQFRVGRWLRKHKGEYDVVHASHLSTAWISEFSVSKQHKVVFDVPDYFTDSRRFMTPIKFAIKKVETFFLNHADAVIITSEERVTQINPAKPRLLAVVFNSPDVPKTSRVAVNQKSDKTKIKLAYIGGLTPFRMLPELLKVVEKDERLTLEIAGSGILEQQVKLFERNCDRIHFLGQVPYEQVLSIEQQADILTALYDPAIANHRYASPNKFFEAMALGKPVVMVLGTGMATNLSDNGYGAVISGTGQIDLANGINLLIDNRECWPRNAVRMQCDFEKKFSWRIMEKRILALYDTFEDDTIED